ncbi:MAG: hypothetical protein LDLANPLL_01964 [Turneriella sp.]|nr:hypothetical protein [Turneriella sp.]
MFKELQDLKSRFERDFFLFLKKSSLKHSPPLLREATLYSLSGRNKRIRPVLSLEAARVLNLNYQAALCIASAVECLHTYSLVHDDLPAMDNDDFRRGQLSCHKKYGEATAILVGDLLQSLSFEFLASANLFPKAIVYFARAVGSQGMVSGQFLDMESQGENTMRMHQMKTGRLIEASIALPFFALEKKLNRRVAHWGRLLGLLFQITDDLLDATQSSSTLGKTAGKDAAQNKKTVVALWGKNGAQQYADELTNLLTQRAKIIFPNSPLFLKLPAFLSNRNA